jgi:hypothetical protein
VSILARPHHPIVADALTLSRQWGAGHVIDNAPALAHAVRVAVVLGRHIPDPAPELVAAVLLHDSPEFAPADIDLDALLTTRLGPAVTTVVRQLEREHRALDHGDAPGMTTVGKWTVWASTADKIVSLRSILGRAELATDPAAYWTRRAAFLSRVGYFRAFHTAAAPLLPSARMSTDLARLVDLAEQAARTYAMLEP